MDWSYNILCYSIKDCNYIIEDVVHNNSCDNKRNANKTCNTLFYENNNIINVTMVLAHDS